MPQTVQIELREREEGHLSRPEFHSVCVWPTAKGKRHSSVGNVFPTWTV